MDRLEIAVSELSTDLDRVEHLLNLVKDIRKFGASTIPAEQPEGVDGWAEANKLWKEAKSRRTDLPLVAGSLLLYLSGRFEYFVRIVVEIAPEEIAENCQAFSQLPEQLRKELIQRTAEVVQKPKRFGYDETKAEGLILSLADSLRASDSVLSINSQCLSATETNLRPDALRDLMKRIGMENLWADIGKQAKAKLYLSETIDGNTSDRNTSKEAQNRLNGIMEERNCIAHPTGETTFPDPDKVLDDTKFFRMLGSVLGEIVRVYVTVFGNERKGR